MTKRNCNCIGCGKPVIENSLTGCCKEHEEILLEISEKEYREYQEQVYNDYITDIRSGL